MGYLGNTPGESFISFAKQVFTIVNSQTAYTLDFAVVDENELRLVINNVVQEPGSGKAYTASGTTLTLSAALTNGTDEMYCVFLGKARETVTVPDITRDKLNLISDASNPSLIAKGTSGVSEGYIQLNCAENSHGIKLKSPPHSAGQSYTLTFPQSISADTFLKTDGSGNLSFASAGGTNTPAFEANITGSNANFTQTSWTKVTFNGEVFDTDSKYDNSSNYRFTPGTAGKYFIYAMIKVQWGGAAGNGQYIAIYKNGSLYRSGGINGQTIDSIYTFATIDFNTTDYVEIYVYSGSNFANAPYTENRHVFGGYRILT